MYLFLYLFLLEWLNKTTVHNRHILANILDSRPKNKPLITVSNHHSCFDDPGIWGRLCHDLKKKKLHDRN